MDKKKLLILFFVTIIFGNQVLNTSYQIVKGGFGMLVTILVLVYLCPSIYDQMASKLPVHKDIDTASEFRGKINSIPKNIFSFFDSIGDNYCKNRGN